jgi:hypothetical protein
MKQPKSCWKKSVPAAQPVPCLALQWSPPNPAFLAVGAEHLPDPFFFRPKLALIASIPSKSAFLRGKQMKTPCTAIVAIHSKVHQLIFIRTLAKESLQNHHFSTVPCHTFLLILNF